MVPMLSLWLPILLSAFVVFVVSSIIHTVLGYHASDFEKLRVLHAEGGQHEADG